MTKVLIIGLGSIGQRHAKVLKELGVSKIAALRTLKGNKVIDPQIEKNIFMFYNEDEAFRWQPTHIVISNPTTLHHRYIQLAVEKKIKFFVEKPVVDSYEPLQSFLNKQSDYSGYVGFVLRFSSIFQFLKKLIQTGEYGKMIMAQLQVGQFLPNWHPYEDYKTGYYAQNFLGGGALRTLSHEIDLAQYLFGRFISVISKVRHLSDLEIDVDDVTTILAETEKCPLVSIFMNFLDPLILRKGTIYVAQGVIEYDWVSKTVTFIDNQTSKKIVLFQSDESTDLPYILQMKEFLSVNESGIACSLSEGMETMRIIESCEKSDVCKKEISLI